MEATTKVSLRDVGASLMKLFAGVPRALGRHISEVDRSRYCKCCGGAATLYVTTVLKRAKGSAYGIGADELVRIVKGEELPESESLALAHAPNFFFCGDHHPLAGIKCDESWALLTKTDARLTFYNIMPNPFK